MRLELSLFCDLMVYLESSFCRQWNSMVMSSDASMTGSGPVKSCPRWDTPHQNVHDSTDASGLKLEITLFGPPFLKLSIHTPKTCGLCKMTRPTQRFEKPKGPGR